ncbi:MAG: phage minor head protein, partial [Methylovulum sp.]|nr:phage minor head protein [Methylovulum sp.]
VVLPDVYYGQLQGLARQKAFSIAGIASYDQLKAVLDDLNKAQANGQTFKQWKRNQSVKDLELPLYRLDNIFRTNIQGQYMRGRWEQIIRTQETRQYLMYDAINDNRTRPAHKALDGFIRPVNDPIWRRISPLNGYRCRCGLISLTEAQAKARSADGKGLNKVYNPGTMQPDTGWDYSPQDSLKGISKAIGQRKAVGGALANALPEVVTIPAITGTAQAGTITDALILPKSGKARQAARLVLTEIDAIHGVSNLPNIPVVAVTSKRTAGSYHYVVGGKPINIRINTGKLATHRELTLAHEIGHFIDHQAVSGVGVFASESSPLMDEWIAAVDASKATELLKVDNPKMAYYLSRREQWARSYAQYIATKSGNPLLVGQLDAIRTPNPLHHDWVAHRQWQDDDFAPISAAIDRIFNKLGWLK